MIYFVFSNCFFILFLSTVESESNGTKSDVEHNVAGCGILETQYLCDVLSTMQQRAK